MATPATLSTVGAGASTVAALIAVGQLESLGFVLQAFGLGSAVGTAVAYRASRRGWSVDVPLILARWQLGFASVAVLFALTDAVLF